MFFKPRTTMPRGSEGKDKRRRRRAPADTFINYHSTDAYLQINKLRVRASIQPPQRRRRRRVTGARDASAFRTPSILFCINVYFQINRLQVRSPILPHTAMPATLNGRVLIKLLFLLAMSSDVGQTSVLRFFCWLQVGIID